MKTVYILAPLMIGESLIHQYTAVKNNNTTILSTSDDPSWNKKGVLCTITDDGNGVEIKIGKNKPFYLDYAQEEELLSALLSNRDEQLRLLHIDKQIDI
jgi:hypothetical protein